MSLMDCRIIDLEEFARLDSRLFEEAACGLLATCSTYIERNPDSASARLLRAKVLLALGLRRPARDDLRDAYYTGDEQVRDAAGETLGTLTLIEQHDFVQRWQEECRIRDEASKELNHHQRGGFTRRLETWQHAAGNGWKYPFEATPSELAAWLGKPNHRTSLPTFERYFAAAERLGYPNPMPEVKLKLLQTEAHHRGASPLS